MDNKSMQYLFCTFAMYLLWCREADAVKSSTDYPMKHTASDYGQDGYGNTIYKQGCVHDIDIVHQLVDFDKSGYNKHRLPKLSGMKVRIDAWIQAITSISESTQDFEVDLYINEMWEDPRLRFDHLNPCKPNMSLDNSLLDKLWTPNTCFINSKEAFIHKSPFTNIFLMIYNNGSVWTNYRVKLTGPCQMELQRFPMDVQKCLLTFESFNYNNAEVHMEWADKNPILILGATELPDFTLVDVLATSEAAKYAAGFWDELSMTFIFKRRYGWYIFQGYIPTYLIIIISWISFHLGTMALPARTMLGVNALIAMTFQFGNIISNLPRVSYIKAIDIWMLSGMTFIFASLLELAVVGHLAHVRTRKQQQIKSDAPSHRGSPIFWNRKYDSKSRTAQPLPIMNDQWNAQSPLGGSLRDVTDLSYSFHELQMKREVPLWHKFMLVKEDWDPAKIDKMSAICFPVIFFLFNVFYWGYYLGFSRFLDVRKLAD